MPYVTPKLKQAAGLAGGLTRDRNVGMLYGPSSLARNLSENLEVGENVTLRMRALPIPDVWGQPLWFSSILKQAANPRNAGAVSEQVVKGALDTWRGMLTMFALRQQCNIPISVQKVALRNLDEQGDLERILARTVPNEHLPGDQTPWNPAYVIEAGFGPIGMLSPLTLVCPAADCVGRIPESVRWRVNGDTIVSPISKEHAKGPWKSVLSNPELKVLEVWLTQLFHSLQNTIQQAQNLLAPIEAFLGDVRENLNLGRDVRGPLNWNPNVTLRLTAGDQQFPGIYANIADSQKLTDDPSHIEVRGNLPTTGVRHHFHDRDVANQWNVDPQTLHGPGGNNLAMGKPADTNTDIFLSRDDLFMKQIFCFPTGWNPFKESVIAQNLCSIEHPTEVDGQGRPQRRDVILPLTNKAAELLEYTFDPNGILTSVSLESLRDGSIRVTIELPLLIDPINNQTKVYKAKKIYSVEDVKEIVVERAANVETVTRIWPGYSGSPDGYWFVQFGSANPRSTLDQPHLDPYVFDTNNIEASETTNVGHVLRQFKRLKQLPKLYSVNWPNHGENGHLGYVVPGIPMEPPASLHAVQVGIDFGTSSTNVFLKIAAQGNIAAAEPEKYAFMAPPLPLWAGAVDQYNTDMDNFFMPLTAPAIPFLSLFRRIKVADAASQRKPQQGGHILLLREPIKRSVTDFPALMKRNDIHSNLKWEGTEETNLLLECFLSQLCAMARTEARMRGGDPDIAEWKFSYPTSLGDAEDFKRICRRSTGSGRVTFESEAVANVLYCQNKGLLHAVGRPALVMDVGAGTTDIAIWSPEYDQAQTAPGNRSPLAAIRLQSSVHFAGRAILHDAVAQIPLLKKELVVNAEGMNLAPYEWYGAMELKLIELGNQFTNEFLNTFDPGRAELRVLLTLAFAGLFHYAGKCVKRLELNDLPEAAITGKGSLLIYEAIWPLLKGVYRQAAGLSLMSEPVIHRSPDPKQEAACGLLVESIALRHEEDRPLTIYGVPAIDRGGGSHRDTENVADNFATNPYAQLEKVDLDEIIETVNLCLQDAIERYHTHEIGRQIAIRLREAKLDKSILHSHVIDAARQLPASRTVPLSLIAFAQARNLLAQLISSTASLK